MEAACAKAPDSSRPKMAAETFRGDLILIKESYQDVQVGLTGRG
jgi:hypothetical protein